MSDSVRAIKGVFMVLIGSVTTACVAENVDSVPTNIVSNTNEETAITDLCEGVPLVNWDTFGSSFISHECQTCHGSWVVERVDAPEEVTFDTGEEVWAQADRVLARATGEKSTMPPNGGTFKDDQIKLAWRLACAPYGT